MLNIESFCASHDKLAEVKNGIIDLKTRLAKSEKENEELKSAINKIGYKVELMEGSTGTFQLVKDDASTQPQGDYLNPIAYTQGMECLIGLWYTDETGNIWECIKSGIPDSFEDSTYFDIITV